MPLLAYLGLAWIAGIYLGSRILLPAEASLVAALFALTAAVVGWRERRLRLVGLCLLFLLLGLARYRAHLPHLDASTIAFYNGSGPMGIKGMVLDDPELRDRAAHIRVGVSEVQVEEEWQRASGTLLLFTTRYPEYHYGDLLMIEGEPETPPQFEDFDYREYLARQGIHAILSYPRRIELLARDQGFPVLGLILAVKRKLSEVLLAILPEPQASLAQGILLGLRSSIPADLSDAFFRTGTTHIIAISGYNVGIVAGLLTALGRWILGRRVSLYFILVGIAVYAVLTGMAPPVLRAALMGGLAALAAHLGRQSHAIITLVLSAALLVAFDPYLLWSVSFQLSFMAIVGWSFASPLFLELGGRFLSFDGSGVGRSALGSLAYFVLESIAITLGATLAILPIIAYDFQILPLVSPLANLFALPALAPIIFTSALASLSGIFYLPLAQLLGWGAWLFLSYMIQVVEFFSKFPIASLEVEGFPEALAWVYYGLLGLLIWMLRQRKQVWEARRDLGRRLEPIARFYGKMAALWLLSPLVGATLLMWLGALSLPDKHLTVSFLDVGQGDAILIQTPSHQKILVDGGPSPQSLSVELGRRLPFWDRSIDLVVLTHPDEDHLAGLIEVLKRYRVRQILESDLPHETPYSQEWFSLIQEKGIQRTAAQAGQRLDLGRGMSLQVLHPSTPPLRGTQSDTNNNAVVLLLATGGASLLLTADIEEEAQRWFLDHYPELRSTFLQVPHHGGHSSLFPAFLARVEPQVAVISVGVKNRFGHPAPETLRSLDGITVLRTDERGSIEITLDGERPRVKTQR